MLSDEDVRRIAVAVCEEMERREAERNRLHAEALDRWQASRTPTGPDSSRTDRPEPAGG